jgi:hypothetical protein
MHRESLDVESDVRLQEALRWGNDVISLNEDSRVKP